jgi:hypothetical protein
LVGIASLGFGDRFNGAGGAFLDAPLNAPEKDAPVPGGLAADDIDNDG